MSYACGFCYRIHRADSIIGEAHAWQDGTPVAPWRTYPIKPLRRLAERRSPDLAGGRFGASPASRDETPALRSGPDQPFSARAGRSPASSFPPVGTGLGVERPAGSRERITGTPPGE